MTYSVISKFWRFAARFGPLVAIAGCTAGYEADSAFAPADRSIRWQKISAENEAIVPNLQEGSLALVGTQLVAIGGRQSSNPYVYNMASGQWRKGAEAPQELHHFQAVEWHGKVIVIGSFSGNYPAEDPVAQIFSYDPSADAWDVVGEVPPDRRRGATSAVVIGDVLYLAGGITGGHMTGHVTWLDQLDLVTGSWSQLSDAPRPRDHAALIEADGELVFIGGRLSKAPDETFRHTVGPVDIYDIATNSWRTLAAPLPTPRAGLAAKRLGRHLYIIGGESAGPDGTLYHRQVEILDLSNEQWSVGPDLICARHGMGSAVAGDTLYVAMGIADNRPNCGKLLLEKLEL